MLYVLKYVGTGPGDFLEHAYDETIVVKNGVAVCQFEHNRDMLLGMNFESIGAVKDEDAGDLHELFKNGEIQVELRKEKVEQPVPASKMVSKDSILPGKPESEQKSWYENLE